MGGLKATIANLFPFLIMILIFYFLLIMPQQKQMKERKKMLESLKKGDKIITVSGIFGEITDIQGEEIKVKITDTVTVKMLKSAVQGLANQQPAKAN